MVLGRAYGGGDDRHLHIFNAQGISGALYQMLSHGIVSAALFLCVGVVLKMTGCIRARDRAVMAGWRTGCLVYAVTFMVFTMASVGLPGTSGFVGEFLVIIGSFKISFWLSLLGAAGMILGA